MKLSWHTSQAWERTAPEAARITLDLNLAAREALETPEAAAAEIARRGGDIRAQLFQMVAEQMVPSITRSMGMPTALPESWQVRGQYHSEDNGVVPAVDDTGVLHTDNHLRTTVALQADRPLNPAQLLLANRAVFADHVANQISHSLRHHYLGAQETNTEFSSAMQNGRVTHYEATPAVTE